MSLKISYLTIILFIPSFKCFQALYSYHLEIEWEDQRKGRNWRDTPNGFKRHPESEISGD